MRELGVDARGEVHELEDLLLLGGEFGVERLHEEAVVVELVATDGAEDLQDPFCGWRSAVPELWVEADLGEVGLLHAGTDLAFDERRDEERQELATEQGLDPGGAVEQHGRGVLDALEQVVTSFEVRLVAVGAKDVGVAQQSVVTDEREAAVAGRVVTDRVEPNVVADGKAGVADLAVAGVGSGSAGAGLLVALWMTASRRPWLRHGTGLRPGGPCGAADYWQAGDQGGPGPLHAAADHCADSELAQRGQHGTPAEWLGEQADLGVQRVRSDAAPGDLDDVPGQVP